jgi:hypothetical protein
MIKYEVPSRELDREVALRLGWKLVSQIFPRDVYAGRESEQKRYAVINYGFRYSALDASPVITYDVETFETEDQAWDTIPRFSMDLAALMDAARFMPISINSDGKFAVFKIAGASGTAAFTSSAQLAFMMCRAIVGDMGTF